MHERMLPVAQRAEGEAGVSGPAAAVRGAVRPCRPGHSAGLLRLPQHHVATVTTNVPGPGGTAVVPGSPGSEQFLPYVPIADQVRVGVAMFSYCGELTSGSAVTGTSRDLNVLADGIEQSWLALTGPKVLVGGDM